MATCIGCQRSILSHLQMHSFDWRSIVYMGPKKFRLFSGTTKSWNRRFRFIVLYSRTMKKRFVSYFGRVKFIGSNSLWNRGFWESPTRCIGEPSTRCCLCHCHCTQTSHNLAAEMGFEGCLKALFACGASLLDKDDIPGDTAIHCACRPRSTPLSCTFH